MTRKRGIMLRNYNEIEDHKQNNHKILSLKNITTEIIDKLNII